MDPIAGIFVGIVALAPPQQPDAVAPQRAIAAMVTVADTEQFCPTEWHLRIDAPADQPVLVSRRPLVEFERLRADGQWEPANGAPGGPAFAPPRGAPLPFRWPVSAGQSFEVCAEVADWRVLGYPGTYRASVAWAVAGDRALRRVVSNPFAVAPVGERGAALAEAQARDDGSWRAYQRAMFEPLELSRKLAHGRWAPSTPRLENEPMSSLEAPGVAPMRVVTRLGFQRLAWACSAAMMMRIGDERDRMLASVFAQCRALESVPGVVGPLARLQRLVLLHASRRPEFADELAEARRDGALLAAARWYPEVARAIGLWSPEGAEPDRIPLPVEVTVAGTEQFCPTVCRFRLDVPLWRDDVVTTVPFVQFLRKTPSGEWALVHGPLGGPPSAPTSFTFDPEPPASSLGSLLVSWRARAGDSTTFFGEVADWRVLGYPGSYQVMVRWQDEGTTLRYATAEFEVRPAGAGGAALLAAQAAQNELWRAYQSFMDRAFLVAELPRWRPPGHQTPPPEALAFLHAVRGLTIGTCEPLLRAQGLPDGLRERIDLFQLQKPWTDASAMADGDERTQALRRVLDLYADFGKHAGFAGAFARLQALVLTKSIGTAAEFEAALARALHDRDLLDLGLSYPETMQAVGLLVEDDPSLSGPAGPGSRSLFGRILERR